MVGCFWPRCRWRGLFFRQVRDPFGCVEGDDCPLQWGSVVECCCWKVHIIVCIWVWVEIGIVNSDAFYWLLGFNGRRLILWALFVLVFQFVGWFNSGVLEFSLHGEVQSTQLFWVVFSGTDCCISVWAEIVPNYFQWWNLGFVVILFLFFHVISSEMRWRCCLSWLCIFGWLGLLVFWYLLGLIVVVTND